MKITLLKYLQKTKWISRRDFVSMLSQEAIFLNWNKINALDTEIDIWDKITIILPNQKNFEETINFMPNTKSKIIVFNKPKGFVVSKDDKFNKTIFQILPKSWLKDFYYIWRLDKESHWLLLLTNNPELVDYFESPKNRVLKIYEVKIDKPFRTSDMIKAKKWIPVDEQWNKINLTNCDNQVFYEELSFYAITPVKTNKNEIFLRVVLNEWKKRHIRRLLKALEYKTLDLRRIKFWKYELWDIKPWKYRIYDI